MIPRPTTWRKLSIPWDQNGGELLRIGAVEDISTLTPRSSPGIWVEYSKATVRVRFTPGRDGDTVRQANEPGFATSNLCWLA